MTQKLEQSCLDGQMSNWLTLYCLCVSRNTAHHCDVSFSHQLLCSFNVRKVWPEVVGVMILPNIEANIVYIMRGRASPRFVTVSHKSHDNCPPTAVTNCTYVWSNSLSFSTQNRCNALLTRARESPFSLTYCISSNSNQDNLNLTYGWTPFLVHLLLNSPSA